MEQVSTLFVDTSRVGYFNTQNNTNKTEDGSNNKSLLRCNNPSSSLLQYNPHKIIILTKLKKKTKVLLFGQSLSLVSFSMFSWLQQMKPKS